MRTICLALALLVAPAAAARTTAHGTEVELDQSNPWFLGDEPVEYCIEAAPGDPLVDTRAHDLVRDALAEWTALIARYGLDQVDFGGAFGGAKALRLATGFREVRFCTAPDRQLTVSFGAAAGDWLRRKVLDFAPYYGLSQPFDEPRDGWWRGGVVWVRDDLPALDQQHILLHELGHVFGFAHGSVYAMSEEAAAMVAVPVRYVLDRGHRVVLARDPALGRIEAPDWPFRLRPGTTIDPFYDRACAGRAGYTALPALPAELAGGTSECYRMALRYAGGDALAPVERFTLEVQQLGADPRTFDAAFERCEDPPLTGPNAFSRSLVEGVSRATRSGIDASEPLRLCSASGTITARGVKLPALLDTSAGYGLRVFAPGAGEWRDFGRPFVHFVKD